MPVLTMNYYSESVQKEFGMNVILPSDPKAKPPYFTLYQLHGLSDDYTAWMRWTSIERYVHGLPLVVVMPDTERGWYTNAVEGYKYEDHIMKDTIGVIERFFPVRKDRRGRAIGGLSMGGYGSMKLALKYPDVFGSVYSHSSAFLRGHEITGRDNAETIRIFGKDPTGGPNDIFALAEKLRRSRMPAIAFDCGTEDFLIKANRDFHKHLKSLKIKHQYREFPGIHEWSYWDEHVQRAIKFHRKSLGF
jgi:putative tributyrin esterase